MLSRTPQCGGLVGLACVLLLSLSLSVLPLSDAAAGDPVIDTFVVTLSNPLPASIAVTYPLSRFGVTSGNPSVLLISNRDNVTALNVRTGAQMWQSPQINLTSPLPSKAAGHMRVDTFGGLWVLPSDGDSLLHYSPCKGTCDPSQLYELSDRIGLSNKNTLGSSATYYAQPPLDLIETIMVRTIVHSNLPSSYLAMWARGTSMPTPALYIFDTIQRKLAGAAYTIPLQQSTSCTDGHNSIDLLIPNQGRTFTDVDAATGSKNPFIYAICGDTVFAFGYNQSEPLFTYDFAPSHNSSEVATKVQGVSSFNSDILMLVTKTAPTLQRLPFTTNRSVTVEEAVGLFQRFEVAYVRTIQTAALIPNSACASSDPIGCADSMMIRVYEATPAPGQTASPAPYPFAYVAAYTYSDTDINGATEIWNTHANPVAPVIPAQGSQSQPFAFNDGSDFDVIFWLTRAQAVDELKNPVSGQYSTPMLHVLRRFDGARMMSFALSVFNLTEITPTTNSVLGCDILDAVPGDRTVFVNCASLYGSVIAISKADARWDIQSNLPPIPSSSSTGASSSSTAASSSTGASSSTAPSSSATPSSTSSLAASSSSSTSFTSSNTAPSSTAGSVVPAVTSSSTAADSSSSTGVSASSSAGGSSSSSSTGAGGSAVESSSSGPSNAEADALGADGGSGGMSGGVKALIVIFCLLVAVVAIILLYRYYRTRQVESARHHMGTSEIEGGGAFGGHSMIELEEGRHGGLDDQDVAMDMHGSVSEDESPVPRGGPKHNEFAEVALDADNDHQLQEPSGLHGADEEEEDEDGETFDAAAVAAAKAAKKKKKAAKKAKKAAKKQHETNDSADEDDDALDM